MSDSVYYSRRWISIIPLLLLLIQLLPQAVSTQSSQNPSGPPETQNSSGAAQTIVVSDTLVYGIFFRQIGSFNAKADEIEKSGGDGRSWRGIYARMAALSDTESQLLDRVAADYIREAGLISARQKAMVEAYRLRNPSGQIRPGETREPPVSYHPFTLEREQLYLRMRDQLQTVLGPQTFARLDSILRGKITGNPQSVLTMTVPTTTPVTEKEKP